MCARGRVEELADVLGECARGVVQSLGVQMVEQVGQLFERQHDLAVRIVQRVERGHGRDGGAGRTRGTDLGNGHDGSSAMVWILRPPNLGELVLDQALARIAPGNRVRRAQLQIGAAVPGRSAAILTRGGKGGVGLWARSDVTT